MLGKVNSILPNRLNFSRAAKVPTKPEHYVITNDKTHKIEAIVGYKSVSKPGKPPKAFVQYSSFPTEEGFYSAPVSPAYLASKVDEAIND